MTIKQTAVWQELVSHQRQLQAVSMQHWFDSDPGRAEHCRLSAAGITLDYSKNRFNTDTWVLLLQLAAATGLKQHRQDLLAGKAVNQTEQRSVMHMATRVIATAVEVAMPPQFTQLAQAARTQMAKLVNAIWSNQLRGFTGEPIDTIINIGIGGSDLGPMMVYEALRAYTNKRFKCVFFSHLDAVAIRCQLAQLNPATSLVIITSKSFTTEETLVNARLVRDWLAAAASSSEQVAQQLFAVTSMPERASAFGLLPQHILPMWDWVGGRYSLWSAVGLVLAISLGMSQFEQLLSGAQAMDQHFCTAPLAHNMPVILALLDVWYSVFWGAQSIAVIPYSRPLRYLPDYLQQLSMESLGKSVNQSGQPLSYPSGMVVWGGVGTNSQHSFHQLLLQGNRLVPVDFILPLSSYPNEDQDTSSRRIAHCLAQSQVLCQGYHPRELTPGNTVATGANSLTAHRTIEGNAPHNLLLFNTLNPARLGALLALYEHRVYVTSVLLGINAFDQWGVERGKTIAAKLLADLTAKRVSDSDGATAALMRYILQQRGESE